jgi:hypothetical protein
MTAPTCNYCGGTGGGVEFPVFPITPGESFGTICVPCDEKDAGFCEHGVYVGGIGRDRLCSACEAW